GVHSNLSAHHAVALRGWVDDFAGRIQPYILLMDLGGAFTKYWLGIATDSDGLHQTISGGPQMLVIKAKPS
ncbi:hypothetical protein, partial [Pseudomonas orientalis]|uniref:hypothetical protein n=1 Tax=Pseudomonas orientalis TaxID=76758 RepID=UPI001A919071